VVHRWTVAIYNPLRIYAKPQVLDPPFIVSSRSTPAPPYDGSKYDLRGTGNLRAIQIPLAHTKIEKTVRYLGLAIEHALIPAERTEI